VLQTFPVPVRQPEPLRDDPQLGGEDLAVAASRAGDGHRLYRSDAVDKERLIVDEKHPRRRRVDKVGGDVEQYEKRQKAARAEQIHCDRDSKTLRAREVSAPE